MRAYLVVAVVGALTACRPAAHVAIDSGGVPVVTANPDAAFGALRPTLSEVAASHPAARLRLAATTDEERVELAADDNDDLEDLVVVRVTKRETVVAGQPTTTDDEIRSIAETGVHGTARFAVVRADDDARVSDVMRATRAIKGADVAHTILSRRAPSARAPSRLRDGTDIAITCDWPRRAPRAQVGSAKALVEVVRDAGGVGRVRVISAPAGGFRQAAAFCASTAELPASGPNSALQVHVEFEVGNYLQCATPGDDLVSVGMYSAAGNSRYGTTPSSGCDRFPR